LGQVFRKVVTNRKSKRSETCAKGKSKSLVPFSYPGARNVLLACYTDTLWLERVFAYANGCPDSAEGLHVVIMRISAINGNMFLGWRGVMIDWMPGGGPLG